MFSEKTVKGKTCAPRFTYKGRDFEGCTTFDGVFGRAWCSLDENYAGRWENCQLPLECLGKDSEY